MSYFSTSLSDLHSLAPLNSQLLSSVAHSGQGPNQLQVLAVSPSAHVLIVEMALTQGSGRTDI